MKRDTQRREGNGHKIVRSFSPQKMPWSSAVLGVILLCCWIVVGTSGFVLIEHWSLLDAFYMTIITLSTVGFQEVHPLSPYGRLFTTFIIGMGLATAIYTLTSVGRLVLEGELVRTLGRRRMKSGLERLHDHCIVCGFGRVGRTVVERLEDEGLPFCVVDRDPTLEEELSRRNVLYLIGDATDEEKLALLGIRKAKSLLALLPSNADNLYVTLTAKSLRPEIVVVARASDERAEVKLKQGGADHVVSPYRMAGLRVLHAAVHSTVVEFIELVTSHQQMELSLGEIQVCKDSMLDGKSIAEAEMRSRYGTIVVAIKRTSGEMVFDPAPQETIAAGDILVGLAKETDLKTFEQACTAANT